MQYFIELAATHLIYNLILIAPVILATFVFSRDSWNRFVIKKPAKIIISGWVSISLLVTSWFLLPVSLGLGFNVKVFSAWGSVIRVVYFPVLMFHSFGNKAVIAAIGIYHVIAAILIYILINKTKKQ